MKSGLTIIVISLLLAGCSIEQNVKPVMLSGADRREICVIEDPSVRASFLDAYKSALSQKNFAVRMLPAGSAVNACPLTTTYTANWLWDLALYLAYADLKVYRDGVLEGEAQYDSRSGGANTAKFIDADKKVRELTEKLLPN